MLQKFNPKNADLQVFVGDGLYPRADAKVSVFDSSVQGGDAVWEGLRVYPEGILHLGQHLDRLSASAKALAFTDIPTHEFVREAIAATLQANGMKQESHIRLTLTRGVKVTSGMDPRLNDQGSCLIVLAEWKPLVYDNQTGIKVITSSMRRNGPSFLDSKIHHNNLLNNILAKIQANVAGVDAAIMLDDHGFVSELNDTNLFMIKDGVLFTPHADACLPGISRAFTLKVALDEGWQIVEKNLSLTEFYNADCAFATGTMGELTPITTIDGRELPKVPDTFHQLVQAYKRAIPQQCEPL